MIFSRPIKLTFVLFNYGKISKTRKKEIMVERNLNQNQDHGNRNKLKNNFLKSYVMIQASNPTFQKPENIRFLILISASEKKQEREIKNFCR